MKESRKGSSYSYCNHDVDAENRAPRRSMGRKKFATCSLGTGNFNAFPVEIPTSCSFSLAKEKLFVPR